MSEGERVELDASAALAQSREALHPIARGLFDRLGIARDVSAATRAEIVRRLGETNAHPSVLAFDETFGGLMIPCAGFADWRSKGLFNTVGAYYTKRLALDTELTLVCVTNYDFNHYLDAAGRGWTHDTIEGPGPLPVSADGAGLVTFLIACELLLERNDQTIVRDEPSAAPIARSKGLTLICDGGVQIYASDTTLLMRWQTGRIQMCEL